MTVHLIGICGTAMATLAAMLQERGYSVQGSDQHVYPPMSDFLAARDIAVHDGFDADRITDGLDLVVIGNVVSRGNPEVEATLDRKVRYCSLPEMVRETFLWERRSLVVAGTHGKTTTTSLLAWVLTAGGRDPSFLVGGVTGNFGSSYRLGSGSEFIIEGDEYDSAFFDKTAKFLKYVPDVLVLGNLEFDHADIYTDVDGIRQAMASLVALLPARGRLIVGADDHEALALGGAAPCQVESFGLGAHAEWRATELVADVDVTRFTVTHGGRPEATVTLPLIGAFNVRNALATFAVARHVGLDASTIADALSRFKGVRRRLEVRGVERGVTVYDDFAHHPTAVRETLAGVRAAHPDRRIWALFEPRSATACRRVFQDPFGRAFNAADEVIVGRVYRASLPDEERLSEAELVDAIRRDGPRARHLPEVEAIVATVATEAISGDLVVVMSNGSFDGIHQKLLDRLAADG
ncbi:MAG: UDP-N-acetylmuramate:L-alanyl-gamma-D-glutamyl-meso-diaminopimelate ligase [Acidobacteria bacterium]|nr:UDP-N-acetylmuramate:L-alanyl-gamma-D-glutamyl-meso-diaminopimelate ligase [Acidobacteriota bacterium]